MRDKSYMERSHFLFQYTLKISWKFLSNFRNMFKIKEIGVLATLKTNLRRIALNIEEYEREEADGVGVYTLTDMLRATLHVKSAEQMILAYEILSKMEDLNIVKIENNLCTGF